MVVVAERKIDLLSTVPPTDAEQTASVVPRRSQASTTVTVTSEPLLLVTVAVETRYVEGPAVTVATFLDAVLV